MTVTELGQMQGIEEINKEMPPVSGQSKLEVRSLKAFFDKTEALKGINVKIPERKITAIIGPSGCGKSTLLRCMNRMHELTPRAWVEGEILLDGENIYASDMDAVRVRQRIGMVFQKPNPFPTMSVYDNVAAGLKLNGVRDRKRLDEAVEKSLKLSFLWEEVKDRLKESGARLSGGQQQRVALARALAIEPEIVLLDEPFSSLDASMRAAVRADVLGVLRTSGTTSILVTHDQDEALSMADQVAVLRHGVIAQLDTPSALYGRPGDAELAQFLGESNLLEGEVRDGVATTSLGRLPVGAWAGPSEGGRARVMVRPEQIVLGDVTPGVLEGTVASYEYFGHDAVVRVRTGPDGLPDLVVRVNGWTPLPLGHTVGLIVQGSVVAWPMGPPEAASPSE